MIKPAFLTYASDILADTNNGYTWSQIVRYFVDKSVEYNVDIPHSDVKFPMDGSIPNKRTGFRANLGAFSPVQQYEIIEELAAGKPEYENAQELLARLRAQYSELVEAAGINTANVEKARGLLHDFPDAEKQYNSALEKIQKGIYQRNALDDLRLSLELLLKGILKNEKSLENQQVEIGKFFKEKGVSPEIANMLRQLIDYFSKYQNKYVKHNDAVGEQDITFILDLTTAFINKIVSYK